MGENLKCTKVRGVRKSRAACTHTHTHTHTHIRTFMHTYIHTYLYAYIHTYVYAYIHTYTHTYIHNTYIRTYIHNTYIHTYIACPCGEERQTSEHIIFECNIFEAQRSSLIKQITVSGGTWSPANDELITKYLNAFSKFVKSTDFQKLN
jgi:hypothetical protein